MSNLEKTDMLVIYAVKSTPQPDSYYALKYGKGVPHVELFNDYKWAMEVAKNRAKDREKEPAKWSGISNDVTVEERRYASKKNFIKGITFDQRPCWSTWCDELDFPGRQKYESTRFVPNPKPSYSAFGQENDTESGRTRLFNQHFIDKKERDDFER